MKVAKKGTTRNVFLCGGWVVKVPCIRRHLHFLQGCYANWSERRYCKMMKGVDENVFYDLVAPSVWCSWFGLIQVQRRVSQPIRPDEDLGKYMDVCSGDCKPDNFGYLNGRLVCCDYP